MNRTLHHSLGSAYRSFISSFGGSVMNLLSPQTGEFILDVGCGSGDIAGQLAKLGVQVIGIDQSENMIDQAKHKYPALHFEQMNALDLPYHEQFDTIFSNDTLHLIQPPHLVVQNIYRALKPGGRFVAEFSGKNHVLRIITEVLRQLDIFNIPYKNNSFPWYFPTVGEYSTLLEQSQFYVTTAIHFERPVLLPGEDGLRNWLDSFATPLFQGLTTETKHVIMTRVEDRLKEELYEKDGWIAHFKQLRIHAIKTEH
ncbi:methyltransferase domain-containing protein [Priestia megaterium]|nr:methyltransferase domain-containing protein [Priestia megaterium]